MTGLHPHSSPRQSPVEVDARAPSPRAEALAALRSAVEARPWHGAVRSSMSFCIAEIDARLPHGGLDLGSLHEIAPESEADGPAALGFTLALVARHLAAGEGEAMLVLGRGHPAPYGDGLVDLGLDPGRLLLLKVESDTDAHRAMEESLRARGLRAVIGLVEGGLPLRQSRRLHLAAERAGRLLLVLRPSGAVAANVAVTRWRIAAAPAPRDRFDCLALACWRVHLDRCRNGRTGRWLVEWDHAAHRFGLAGALADHAAEARAGRGAGCV